MTLKIYASADPSAAFSQDSEYTNPISNAFDGVSGGVRIRKYYIRNDDATKYYTDITVQPVAESGTNIINGTNGYKWQMIAGDEEPLEAEWAGISPANSISIPNIGSVSEGDTSTYEPFWVRMTVPAGAPVQSYSNVKLRMSVTESLVS